MELFAVVVLLLLVGLLIYSETARGVALVALLVIGGSIYSCVKNNNEREAKALEIIKPEELAFNDVTLGQTFGSSWKIAGTVKNNNLLHTLDGFWLRVVVQDCPDGSACETIGQDDVSVLGVSVPPGQLRTFDGSVSLPNMPTPRNMTWRYTPVAAKAAVR